VLYAAARGLCLRLLKAPQGPPDPPTGSHASVRIHRASPRYLSYRLLAYWIGFGALWCALWVTLAAGLMEGEPAPIALALVLMALVSALQFLAYFLVRIDYDMRFYVVTDRSLRVRQGALTIREETISYANVQNIRVVQGPLERFFGLWNLEVDTAGGGAGGGERGARSGHRIRMAGIESAHAVRDGILGHLRLRGVDAGLGDADDARAQRAPGAPDALLAALEALRASAAGLRAAAARSLPR
jgi:membrane protein YdbS with pleckstrin-like domain